MNLIRNLSDVAPNRRPLFIDYHGTLNCRRFWDHLPVEEFSRIDRWLFGGQLPLVDSWMKGDVDYFAISEIIGNQLDLDPARLRSDLRVGLLDWALPSELCLSIRRCRQSFETILLTDNMDCFVRWGLSNQYHLGLFDAVICSSELSACKVDLIPDLAGHLLNGRVRQAVLVDDNPNLVKVGQEVGFLSFTVHSIAETQTVLNALSERQDKALFKKAA